MKDSTAVVHVIWHALVVRALKTGDLAPLARVLLNEPDKPYPGDLQLLGKLFQRSKLIAKKRGPKSRPIEHRLQRAAEVYRTSREHAKQIKQLSATRRAARIEAEASFNGVSAKQFERHLFDRKTMIKAAADFCNVTVGQLEQHLKRGPRPGRAI